MNVNSLGVMILTFYHQLECMKKVVIYVKYAILNNNKNKQNEKE